MADRARNERPRINPRAVGWLAGAGLLLLGGTGALADHSMGNACTTCHSLRSTSVVTGTRNINSSLIYRIFPYGPDNPSSSSLREDAWYCPGSTIDPRSKLDGTFVGGDPLDCSYCHKAGTDDIGSEIGNASDVVGGGGVAAKTASAHPVDTKATANKSWGSRRIACNECHSDDVSPLNLCTKGTGTGYPNHGGTLTGNPDTLGLNQRTGAAAHLRTPYDAAAGSNWTTTTGILCFDCHKSGGLSDVDVKSDYDKVRGGHNIDGIGSLGAKKLPCYDCHDPHGVGANAKLIIEDKQKITDLAKENPFGTSYKAGQPPPASYDGTNDREVCYGCHKAYTVEGVALPDVLASAPSAFAFHANVHKEVGGAAWAGNCLQKNGGCHQSVHNTDIYRCLDCHSAAVTGAMAAAGVAVPARLLAANHIDSEFGHIGDVLVNDIQSVHSIPYRAKVFTVAKTAAQLAEPAGLDMSTAADNGCLYCHGGPMLKDADGQYYPGLDPATLSNRQDLEAYDQFCLSCHDGNGPTFTVPVDYALVDGDGGTLTHTAGTYYPPKINNPSSDANPSSTSWKTGYYFTSGHGRGTSSTSGNYAPSGNSPAKIPCLECHVYHGSTAFKLLPGWRETADGLGHVVKGKSYTPVTVDTKLSIGGVTDGTKIDYTDYTDDGKNTRLTRNYFFSNYVSDYTNGTYWSTQESGTTVAAVPVGTFTRFGTSGDMAKGNTNSVDKGADAQSASKIGFCDTCHFYAESTDGTVETAGLAYTHEGQLGATDSDNQPLKSTMTFFKDCCECHDPHGSGKGGAGDTADENIYMIRKRIRHAPKTKEASTNTGDWSAVVFKSLTGADNFDEDDTDNKDDLCAVCHQSASENGNTNVDHNYRSWAGTPTTGKHQEGSNCLTCHPHGEK